MLKISIWIRETENIWEREREQQKSWINFEYEWARYTHKCAINTVHSVLCCIGYLFCLYLYWILLFIWIIFNRSFIVIFVHALNAGICIYVQGTVHSSPIHSHIPFGRGIYTSIECTIDGGGFWRRIHARPWDSIKIIICNTKLISINCCYFIRFCFTIFSSLKLE